jgi:predicted alpha/beta superfamily hydrolase
MGGKLLTNGGFLKESGSWNYFLISRSQRRNVLYTMKSFFYFLSFALLLFSCDKKQVAKVSSNSKMMYSSSVQDSFRIYTSFPSTYEKDSSTYPLILVLDANAYFDPVVAEYNLGKLTQGYPDAIIVGIGYKDFATLDSLRFRDYTFPVAPASDSISLSGEGDHMKQFIDLELLPELSNSYRINEKNVTLMGHSLGGYFVLYHMIESIAEKKYTITNYIAASPSLFYHDFYLNDRLKELDKTASLSLKLYSSVGTNEYEPAPAVNHFPIFKNELHSFAEATHLKVKGEEYSNFAHMDAAMPGFMKGLIFVLVEE